MNLLISIRLTLVLAFLCCGIYPLLLWSLAQATPHQGLGQQIQHQGKQYFLLIGQKFTADGYFQSRPSAVDYNAAGAAGSNKGPSNPDYLAAVAARIDSFLVHNPKIKRGEIPADLVTASGSGLDLHLSKEAALVQVPRIAAYHHINPSILRQLVLEHVEGPVLGLLGPERVHVLNLNLALEQLKNKL